MIFSTLAERVNDIEAFVIALAVTAGAALTHSWFAVVPVVMFAVFYVALSDPNSPEPPTHNRFVTGTVTQTIPPDEVSGYAIWGDLKEYAETNDLALHTIRTGYRTRYDKWLATKPLLGRLARAEAEHVAAPEPLTEGAQVSVEVHPATTEQYVGIEEVSD